MLDINFISIKTPEKNNLLNIFALSKIVSFFNKYNKILSLIFIILLAISAIIQSHSFFKWADNCTWLSPSFKALLCDDISFIILILTAITGVIEIINLITTDNLFKTNNRLKEKEKHHLNSIENIQTDINSIYECFLYHLSKRLKFKPNGQERITLYYYTENKGCKVFNNCGRFSNNRKFKEIGRPRYSIDSGVIGQVWDNHSFFMTVDDPRKYPKEKRYGLSQELINSLTMPSKLIYGKRIDYETGSGSNNKSIGVLIIESTNIDWKKQSAIDRIVDEEIDHIAALMMKFKSYIPIVETAAAEEGF